MSKPMSSQLHTDEKTRVEEVEVMDEVKKLFIWLGGNLSDGFTATGPYESLEDVCDAHDFDEGWLMVLEPPKRSEVTA
jgi:hypothetical protein